MDADRYQAYLDTADMLVSVHVEQLGLEADSEIDWAHRIPGNPIWVTGLPWTA